MTGEFTGAEMVTEFGDREEKAPRELEGRRPQVQEQNRKNQLLMTEATIDGTASLPDAIEGR